LAGEECLAGNKSLNRPVKGRGYSILFGLLLRTPAGLVKDLVLEESFSRQAHSALEALAAWSFFVPIGRKDRAQDIPRRELRSRL
jgi:hypothetical protein